MKAWADTCEKVNIKVVNGWGTFVEFTSQLTIYMSKKSLVLLEFLTKKVTDVVLYLSDKIVSIAQGML